MQFYKDNGQLCYHYYRVLLGDGSGHNIGFEHTTFEYYSGRVVLYANQGTCQCLIDGTNNKVGIAFYLDSIKKGYITNQETGELFYRVQQ